MGNDSRGNAHEEARRILAELETDGDPFNGKDWALVQILRRFAELEAENAALREALKPFAAWWERYGRGSLTPPPPESPAVDCYRASVILSSGAEPGAGGGQQT